MAQYKTHTKFNIILALPFFIWAIVYFFSPSINLLATFIICFIYATLFMNPDLDIANKIKLLSFRGLLTFPFRTYSFIFRHRGISHTFLIGSITRILWLTAFLYLALFFLKKPLFNKEDIISLVKSDYFLYGFFAIVAADFCHLLLDLKIKR
jgi:uncharacterized metal-binding protein